MPRPLALLAAILIACGVRSEATPTPRVTSTTSPSSAASSAAPSATASPSPTPRTAVLDERFGFLVADDAVYVRSETDPAKLSSFTAYGGAFSWGGMVSPDGRSVAYWDPIFKPGAVLHVRPVAGGSPRTLLTLPPDMRGNNFAWSSDGAGLAVAIDNDCQEICAVQGGGRSLAELWTVDVASGASEKIATAANGVLWIPLTWDRTSKIVAAAVTGPGGYMAGYDLIDLRQKPYAVRSTELRPTVLGAMAASSDARYVALINFGGPATGGKSALTWWPLAEPQKKQDVPFDGAIAVWRPGSSEIWWAGGLTPPDCRVPPCISTELVAHDVTTGARRSVLGSFGERILGFRADGSAAITLKRGSPDAVIVTDLQSGQSASVTVRVVVGSVRLR